jgi:hypothetical protein
LNGDSVKRSAQSIEMKLKDMGLIGEAKVLNEMNNEGKL